MNNSHLSNCSSPVPQDMLEILINGIFAFTMTLMVKNNIPLPTGQFTEDLLYFLNYFDAIYYDGINFVFTFVLLAIFYILTFEIIKYIRILDRVFVYIIFGFLLSIVFIPLTSLLWSISDQPIPYGILFHTNILICGMILYFLLYYSSRVGDLFFHETDKRIAHNLSIRIAVFPMIAILGLSLDCQDISFGIIPLLILYFIPIFINVWYVFDPEPDIR
jgi:uncharacterized membrane protein